jgi:adenylosuccinate synthase
MSGLFEEYLADFESCTTRLDRNLGQLQGGGDSVTVGRLIAASSDELEAAASALAKLRIEARSKDQASRVKKMERMHRDLSQQLRKAKAKASRASLVGTSPGAGPSALEAGTGSAYQQRLARNQERMQSMNERMADMRRTLADTEDTAAGALDELYSQREVLIGAGKKNQEAQSVMTEARRVLTRMGRREAMTRCATNAVMLLVVVGFFIFLYYMFFGGRR